MLDTYILVRDFVKARGKDTADDEYLKFPKRVMDNLIAEVDEWIETNESSSSIESIRANNRNWRE